MFFEHYCIWCKTFIFFSVLYSSNGTLDSYNFYFYNEIASIYVGMYGVISIVGNLLGSFVKKYFKIEREKMIE